VKSLWLPEPRTYEGDALAPHWIYKTTRQMGDAVVAFAGPANVTLDHMVDVEDVLLQAPIYSRAMLHFVVELFGPTLREGILLQQLWMSAIQADINRRLDRPELEREGDDLYAPGRRKLSVAITTRSLTSVLMHVGLNLDSADTPVPTVGLASDWGLTALADSTRTQAPATDIMQLLIMTWDDINRAQCKVRSV
jgi:uncharacterized protein